MADVDAGADLRLPRAHGRLGRAHRRPRPPAGSPRRSGALRGTGHRGRRARRQGRRGPYRRWRNGSGRPGRAGRRVGARSLRFPGGRGTPPGAAARRPQALPVGLRDLQGRLGARRPGALVESRGITGRDGAPGRGSGRAHPVRRTDRHGTCTGRPLHHLRSDDHDRSQPLTPGHRVGMGLHARTAARPRRRRRRRTDRRLGRTGTGGDGGPRRGAGGALCPRIPRLGQIPSRPRPAHAGTS